MTFEEALVDYLGGRIDNIEKVLNRDGISDSLYNKNQNYLSEINRLLKWMKTTPVTDL